MLLLINLENWKDIKIIVLKKNKIVFSRSCMGYTELVKKIHRVSTNFDINKYTIIKFDKNISVVLNNAFEFKKDLKALMKDIRIVRKPFTTGI